MLSPALLPCSFAMLPGWERDDGLLDAFAAFRRSAYRVLEKPYRTGSLGVACQTFAPAYAAARDAPAATESEARRFFETFFQPAFVQPDGGKSSGLVTGFYEPEAEASPVRTGHFPVPLYSRPDDLVEVNDANRPKGMDPYLAFARRFARRISGSRGDRGRGACRAWFGHRVAA